MGETTHLRHRCYSVVHSHVDLIRFGIQRLAAAAPQGWKDHIPLLHCHRSEQTLTHATVISAERLYQSGWQGSSSVSSASHVYTHAQPTSVETGSTDDESGKTVRGEHNGESGQTIRTAWSERRGRGR